MKKYAPYITVVAAMMMWSAAGIAIKQALLVFTPLTLIVIRFSQAVLLMLAVGLLFRLIESRGEHARSTGLALQFPERQHWLLFLLCGFFQPFLYFLLETLSYRAFASPTVAETLLSTGPIFAPLFAFAILRERVTLFNIVGILISTCGVLVLVLAGSAGRFDIGDPWGVLWAFLAVSSAVFYSIMLRRIPLQYNSISVVFSTQFASMLFFLPLWLCTDDLTFASVHNADPQTIAAALQAVAYLAICCSTMAFILFCYTVRRIGVTQANVFNNVRPVFTALLMWLLFDEHLPVWKWIGIILIIFGLFVCQKR